MKKRCDPYVEYEKAAAILRKLPGFRTGEAGRWRTIVGYHAQNALRAATNEQCSLARRHLKEARVALRRMREAE